MKKLILSVIMIFFSLTAVADIKHVGTQERKSAYSSSVVHHVYLPHVIHYLGETNKIIAILDKAKKGDDVVVHIQGYGGDASIETALVNALKRSKANILLSVDGPVYSAHAFLALTKGKNIKVRVSDNSFFMFHHISGLNTDCSKSKGSDRGVSNKLKCQRALDYHVKFYTKSLVASTIGILTVDQVTEIFEGRDVYVSSKQIKDALRKQGRLVE